MPCSEDARYTSDRLVEHGTLKELHRECGYDAQGIAEGCEDEHYRSY